jgi:hypothetical protein
MSALAERSGRGEVKPSLFRAVMKTDARALTQEARGKPQLLEPPGADPHAGWCGRGERETAPPIPIADAMAKDASGRYYEFPRYILFADSRSRVAERVA